MILIDSDIFIEIARDRDTAILGAWKRLRNSSEPLSCSPITVAEVWCGARPAEHDALTRLFQAFICLPIDEEIGRRAGDYLRLFSRSHSVEISDTLIAATASVHNAELWTRNRKHYPMKELTFYRG